MPNAGTGTNTTPRANVGVATNATSSQQPTIPVYMWLSLVGFLGGIVYTMVAVSQATGSSSVKNDMAVAITNVTVVNTVLMLVLAGTAYYYVVSAGATTERLYVMFMLHVTLLISLISVSVSCLQPSSS
jgi:hypothetical protein